MKVIFYSNTYEAIVVGEKSVSAKNSFKNSYSERIMYAAIVEFENNKGQIVRIETNDYSEKRPVVGSKRKIAYSGKCSSDTYASDLSLTSTILLFLGVLFVGLLAIISYLIGSYSFEVDKKIRKKWAKNIFLIFTFLGICIILCRILKN